MVKKFALRRAYQGGRASTLEACAAHDTLTALATRLGSLTLLIVVSVTPAAAQQPPLWSDISRGEYDAGFRRVWTLDQTRVWPRSEHIDQSTGEIGRPIRVDVWYPASCDSSKRMPFRGYLEMDSPGPAFDDLVFLTRRWDEYSYRGLAPDSAVFDRLMETPTAACYEAGAAAGAFPLITYSAGWFNRTPDNTILAEFLASHGFVVAAVPQSNPGLWTFNFGSDAASVETQVRDLEVAIGALAGESMVDRRHIISMGYSTGGDVALLLQGRNPLVNAVVGLDASWSLGSDNDVTGSPFFIPDNHVVPVLVARRPTENSQGDGVLVQLDSAPRMVVEVPGADHGSFGDDNIQRYYLGDRKPEYESGHAAVARVVLDFLTTVVDRGQDFAGDDLARIFRERGLDAAYHAPSVSSEESEHPTP